MRSSGEIVVATTTTQTNKDFAVISYLPGGSLSSSFDITTNSLNGTPTYTEGGSAVVLDGDVKIFDAELSYSNFSGATLTLARHGGADSSDAIAFDGTTVSVSGANVYVSGTLVGTYTFTGGTMSITFNSNATQPLVNSLMQNIVYWNTSDNPPGSVQIDWTFSDGNTGSQGTGGTLTAIGSTTVTIASVNDAPTTSAVTLNSIAEDSGARLITQAELLTNATDVEGNALTATAVNISSGSGSLVNNGNGTWTYTPALNDDTTVSLSYSITDGNGGSVAGSANLDITPVNDAPVITSNGGGATGTDSVAENQTAITTVTVTDNDLPAQTISYSIVGGADAALFTINASTGALQFISGRNYESPTDADANNVYEVIVQAGDGAGGTDTQAISVSVTPVNEAAPVITSNGGGSAAAISINENTSSVTTVTATDNDLPAPTLTYFISGGADAAKSQSTAVMAYCHLLFSQITKMQPTQEQTMSMM